MKKVISTPKAPAAIGPYSQAIETEQFLFTSGQIPIDPAVGEITADTIEGQAEQVTVSYTHLTLPTTLPV